MWLSVSTCDLRRRRSSEEPLIDGAKPRSEAASVVDTLGFGGLAIRRRYRDGSTRTKFMSFADDPKHPNEYIMNLATGNGQLKTGVRWWDTSGQQMPGGVPLLPPSGTDENAAFSLVDGEWHVIDALPVVTADAIEAQFPFHMDKKFRAR